MPEQLYADVPEALSRTDALLTQYGRWATLATGSAGRCGSAERAYRGRNRESARAPLQPAPRLVDMLRVQRALAKVPELERDVLIGLYIPGRAYKLRRIPAFILRGRHLAGLYALDALLHPSAQSAPMLAV